MSFSDLIRESNRANGYSFLWLDHPVKPDDDILINPSAVSLEREKQYPNPLLVPHTLGDVKRIRGHP